MGVKAENSYVRAGKIVASGREVDKLNPGDVSFPDEPSLFADYCTFVFSILTGNSMIIRRYVVPGLLLSLVYSVQALAVNAGAYNSRPSKNMEIGTPNQWYRYAFDVSHPPAKRAEVSEVYYEYALGPKDIRDRGMLKVKLCHGNQENCIDISAAQSGSTGVFSGQDASVPFMIYYGLRSTKPAGRLTGSGTTQITVNWSVKTPDR